MRRTRSNQAASSLLARLHAAIFLASLLSPGCTSSPRNELPSRESSPVAERTPVAEATRAVTPQPLRQAPQDGEGHVRIVPEDPVMAGSFGSWTIEWVAGPSGLPKGGGVVLQVSPFWQWSQPQTLQATSPGYTTARASKPGTRLQLTEGEVPMTIVARLLEGRLSENDTLRFVYGDSASGDGRSLARADSYAEEFEELLIKTDGNGDGFFAAVPAQPTLRILPGPPAELEVASRAVVEPGEPFELGVTCLDVAGNWTTFAPGRIVVAARRLRTSVDEPLAAPETLAVLELENPEKRVTLERALSTPGLFRLEATWSDGSALLAGANDLLLVEKDSPFAAILWGDIHSHSALSDGTGSPEELFEFARDVAGLDVVAVTDHDAHGLFPLAEGGFERVRDAARRFNVAGELVTLLGYEWTSWTFGHRNVYYPGDAGEVFSFLSEDSDTPTELWDAILPYGGMTIPHHPGGGPVALDWSIPSREEQETVVEICSIHGSSEAEGVERGIYRPVTGSFVRDAFRQGHRLGILAAGDTHDGHPGRRTRGAPANGLAAFRASARTREAVWAALQKRRAYGTSGPRILLATEWGGREPGEDLAEPPAAPLTVHVVAPEPVEVIELIDSAGTLQTEYGGGRRVRRSFLEPSRALRGNWLYVRVVLADGELAWESPFWFPREES